MVRFWPFRLPRPLWSWRLPRRLLEPLVSWRLPRRLLEPLVRTSEVIAYLGLGSNVGDRLEHIRSALGALEDAEDVTVEAVSSVYETTPVHDVVEAGSPDASDAPYLNAAVRVRTSRAARALLDLAHAVEDERGRDRQREGRHGPRPLDIDILVYDDDVIEEPDLVIPHPRLTERAFALVPLAEVMPPGASLPGAGRVSRHLADLAPVEGVELHCRLTEGPGSDADPLTRRPPGPRGGAPRLGEPHGGDRMGGVRRGPPPGRG